MPELDRGPIFQLPAVPDEGFAEFKGQVQSGELGVALLELIDPPQAVQVVVEAADAFQTVVERRFPGVAERRMADVVGQRNRFGQVFVQPQSPGDGPRDLGHFQRVRQPRPVVVVHRSDQHLGLPGHPAESGGIDDAFAVALKRRAEGVERFRVPAPERIAAPHRVRGQMGFEGIHAGSLRN